MTEQVKLGRHHFSSPFWRVNKVLLLLYSSSDSVKSESVKSGKRFTLSSYKGWERGKTGSIDYWRWNLTALLSFCLIF